MLTESQALAEVATWPDGKLQAVAWEIGAGTMRRGQQAYAKLHEPEQFGPGRYGRKARVVVK